MTYLCPICTSLCDQWGNRTPDAVVDPLAQTLSVTCVGCRLQALAERSRGRPFKAGTKTYPRVRQEATLPYKD